MHGREEDVGDGESACREWDVRIKAEGRNCEINNRVKRRINKQIECNVVASKAGVVCDVRKWVHVGCGCQERGRRRLFWLGLARSRGQRAIQSRGQAGKSNINIHARGDNQIVNTTINTLYPGRRLDSPLFLPS